VQLFKNACSGQGARRINSLTHDTRKALIQTTEGLIAVCDFLFGVGFDYVQLREIQSDKIEHEFGVYRKSTGFNSFMVSSDVLSAFQKRLSRFSCKFLESIDISSMEDSSHGHTCTEITFEDACVIEHLSGVNLTAFEEYAVPYVSGWLETKCEDVEFCEEDPEISSPAKDFVVELSRGKLKIPHTSTYDFLRAGLAFLKKVKHKACCRKQLVQFLIIINQFYQFGSFPSSFFRRMSNVLLQGLHKLEKDVQPNAVLYETTLKKARLAK
jgi:hypothetical protein